MILSRYTKRDITGTDQTLAELGIDCIDRMCIALDIETAHGVDLRDGEIERWVTVGDVEATVRRVAGEVSPA